MYRNLGMNRIIISFVAVVCFSATQGQKNGDLQQQVQQQTVTSSPQSDLSLHVGLSEKIGNFSLELLYFTSKRRTGNMIMSPFTVWNTLQVISEAAGLTTLTQIQKALGASKDIAKTRSDYLNIYKYLIVNTTTVQLESLSNIYVDTAHPIDKSYSNLIKRYYKVDTVNVDFSQGDKTAQLINSDISKATHGRIPNLVEGSDFSTTIVLLTNALYFKGQWTAPFNASSTMRQPFYDDLNKQIGEVNMMYNRYTYPFANIKELKGRVIEIPYGNEHRLSMLVILPYNDVTLEEMFLNFKVVPLDTIFKELKLAVENYGEDEIDCFIPRFKISSNLVLDEAIIDMGIHDLFDARLAQLPNLSKDHLYVSKFIHKAEIEVTEEGTVASAVSAAEFANRIGAIRFEANRPFAYVIIEKTTNAIVFGGVYSKPELY